MYWNYGIFVEFNQKCIGFKIFAHLPNINEKWARFKQRKLLTTSTPTQRGDFFKGLC